MSRARLVLTACLLLASPAWAGSDLESATEADKAKASTHYTQGMASFQAGDTAAALAEFELSYQTVKSPNSHLMVGKALIDLGRYVEAHQALTETIAEAERAEAMDPKYAQTKQAAREELARVDAQVVKLKLTVSGAQASASVRVNDAEYGPDDLTRPIVVAPGQLELTLIDGGENVATQTLEGRAGETLNLSLSPKGEPAAPSAADLSPAPAPITAEKRPFPHRRTTAYVAGGIGVAGALGFGLFGVLNHAKYSDVEEQCADTLCSDDARADAERGHTYQTVANVGLVVGVVGIGTAVALILTESDTTAAHRSATRVAVGPGNIQLRGTF
ncbi:MAG TPA: hypothetical protein VFU02_06705 [Polyangiaceae bacterium]|nr:hypothetical protein [Polyangiaceae bacterium]